MKIDLQLFGRDMPPFYGKKDLNKEIEKIDEQINELFIKRAEYVKDLKKQNSEV